MCARNSANIQVRSKLTDPETGRIALSSEILSGGMAGGAQVMSEFNPRFAGYTANSQSRIR